MSSQSSSGAVGTETSDAALRALVREEVRLIVREEISAALAADRDSGPSPAPPAEAERQSVTPESGDDLTPPSPPEVSEPAHPENRPGHAGNLPARSAFGRKVFWRLEGEERVAYRHLWPTALAVWHAWAAGDVNGPARLDALDPSHRAQTMAALGLRWSPPPTQDGRRLSVQPLRSGGEEQSAGELMMQHMTAAISRSAVRDLRPAAGQQERTSPAPVAPPPVAARVFGTLLGWLLIVGAAVGVVYAQVNGRTSALGVTIEAAWLQPVTWGAVAVGVIGLGLLIASKNTHGSG